MSMEDLLKHLTLQNDRTNRNIEEVKKETKEIKQNMEKEFVDIRKELEKSKKTRQEWWMRKMKSSK